MFQARPPSFGRANRGQSDELRASLVGSADKASAYNAGDLGSIPGLGRSPGDGKGYPLQYSGLIIKLTQESLTREKETSFNTCLWKSQRNET